MVTGISYDITFSMCHVGCKGIYHMTMVYAFWLCGMLFQNHRKRQLRIFKSQKLLKPWHKKKTNFVWCMRSYTSCWKHNCTTLDHQSCTCMWYCCMVISWSMILHTIHTNLGFSLKTTLKGLKLRDDFGFLFTKPCLKTFTGNIYNYLF